MRKCAVFIAVLIAAAAGDSRAQSGDFSLWAVDPLVKVFPDTVAKKPLEKVELFAGANEYVSGQVAVRASGELRGLTCEWGELRNRAEGTVIPPESLRWRFVGFIPIKRNTPNTPESNLVRRAPCEIPDPLLEERKMDLPAGRTQPIWLTVYVPRDARPGDYEGRFTVKAGGTSHSVAVSLKVYPFVLPDERHLWVTNWFSPERIAKFHNVKRWSEEHWALLERYAKDMAEHRQTVVLTPLSLIKVTREADGGLSFDYTNFDRWVRLFEKAGVCGRIEISHVSRHGRGGWGSKEFVFTKVSALDKATGKQVSLPPEKGLAPLLRDLQAHLEARGWLDRAMIHIGDEPSLRNIESWREKSRFVHRAAPKLRRLDAIESRDFGGDLEIWVPKLNYLPEWLNQYRRAQRSGGELWFYTCLHPQGYFPNRLLDYPLVGTRILHWINWEYDLDGFLHWGWNFWTSKSLSEPHPTLPPGDNCIVYPGKNGPLDSIRWEMMREGLQDYEEFRLLAEKTKHVIAKLGKAAEGLSPRQRSDEICRRIVRSFTDYEKDPAAFRAARRMLLEEIAAMETPPLAVVATDPPAEVELVPGPIVVEINGAVEEGAKAKMRGYGLLSVKPDGTLVGGCPLSPKRETIEITIEHNGRKKTITRHFRIRPL